MNSAAGTLHGNSTLPELPPLERLRSGGVDLALRRFGPSSAEGSCSPDAPLRLIAFHGGPGLDHHLLLPLAVPLARLHEVWLVDLPGHGASVTPSGRLPGLQTLEGRLTSWLERLPDGVDVLLGHSLGAWLVARLLRRRRVAPRAAVLIAPPAAGQESSATALRRAVRAIGEGVSGAGGSGRGHRARRELRAHVAAETRGEAGRAFLEAVERAAVRDPWEYGPLLRNFHRAVTGPVRRFEPACPVLVLCGEEDRTTPPGQAHRVVESIVGARLEMVEGAGHYPFAERLGEVAGRIAGLLSELSGRS